MAGKPLPFKNATTAQVCKHLHGLRFVGLGRDPVSKVVWDSGAGRSRMWKAGPVFPEACWFTP